MKQFFKEVPDDYDKLHQIYARRGLRIIAAGYKPLGVMSMHDSSKLTREDIESDLTFGGFLVFSSVLKPESLVVIKHLLESSHTVLFLARSAEAHGLNALTLCSRWQ